MFLSAAGQDGKTGVLNAADVFDRHTPQWLLKGIAGEKPLPRFSLKEAARLKTLSAEISSVCLVVKTNDGNLAKALVGWGYRRSADKDDQLIPVLLIERYVTYRGNRSGVTVAAGKNVMLFAGFRFNFDIGQVVPAGQGGDIRFTEKGEIEPMGKARLFALNGSQLPPEKNAGPSTERDGVLPRDFAGTWNVSVDGRWNGELRLEVEPGGKLHGKYTSAESKSTYDVTGRIAALRHHVKLVIHLDNAQQTIDAFLFTRNKSTMAGFSTLAGRRFGFQAIRVRTKRNSAP